MESQNSRLVPDNAMDHLLVLRFFACMLVFFIHLSLFVPNLYEQNINILGHDVIWVLHSPGQIGVGLFFTLSGYLMSKGFSSQKYEISTKGFRLFYASRALRIIPLYLFCILIMAVFIDPRLLTNKGCVEIWQLLTFTYNTRGPLNVNMALWTISTEMQFYAIVPLLALLVTYLHSRISLILILSVVLIFGPCIRFLLWLNISGNMPDWTAEIYTPLYGNIDCFLGGFLLSPLLINRDAGFRPRFSAYLALPLTYIAGSYWYYSSLHLNQNAEYYVIFFPTVSTLIGMLFIYNFDAWPRAPQRSLGLKELSKKPIRALELGGILTYGIYVWHPIVLTRIATVVHGYPFLMYARLLTFGLIMTLLISGFTYFCIEKYFYKSQR